ncbi:MAG: FAD:protein FMN transferase [Bacteroidales bacterium]|nr:FAD:protein FMN transferase [Bacteroidales bacterium]
MNSETEYIAEGRIFHGFVPHAMGTKLDLLAVGTEAAAAEALWTAFCAELSALEAALNRFDPRSEVARFNASESKAGFPLSPAVQRLLDLSREFWFRTEGLFDVTRGHGMDLEEAGATLDFGGIAKGYVLALLRDRLAGAGIASAFVNFGDSAILGLGTHPYGDCWKVSLPNPYGGSQVAEFSLKDRALSVSGNTPGYTGHIIDPRTGRANVERKLVAVTGPDPLEAEVLSTALMLADKGQRLRLRRAFPDCESEIYTV